MNDNDNCTKCLVEYYDLKNIFYYVFFPKEFILFYSNKSATNNRDQQNCQ